MEPVISSSTFIPLGLAVSSIVSVICIMLWFNKTQKQLKDEIRESVREQLKPLDMRVTLVESSLTHQNTRISEISERTVRIETKLDIALKDKT